MKDFFLVPLSYAHWFMLEFQLWMHPVDYGIQKMTSSKCQWIKTVGSSSKVPKWNRNFLLLNHDKAVSKVCRGQITHLWSVQSFVIFCVILYCVVKFLKKKIEPRLYVCLIDKWICVIRQGNTFMMAITPCRSFLHPLFKIYVAAENV